MHRTALYDTHIAAGARMVNFAGWEMPLSYASQVQEHHAVRKSAGLFDVSHMAVVDIDGDTATSDLSRLLANDIGKIANAQGKALYSVMLNHQAGVIDDLMVYRTTNGYRVVFNCANEQRDLEWLAAECSFATRITPRRDLSMLALQGPQALALLKTTHPNLGEAAENLKPFFSCCVKDIFIATTGYTGERGVEIIIPNEQATVLWKKLCEAGVQPVGLAARDTLRLEAGMCLHGNEMDENTNPLQANLGWTVAWEPQQRDFIGREVLAQKQDAPGARLVGLVLQGRGVLRAGQRLFTDSAEVGIITSGGFSPSLGQSIALARVQQLPSCVEIRNRKEAVRVVRPVFVRNGREIIEDEQEF